MADTQFTTIDGQRWDQIAHIVYGSADKMPDIIKANPEVPLYDIFPAGVVLNIPIIDKTEVQTNFEKLPFWK